MMRVARRIFQAANRDHTAVTWRITALGTCLGSARAAPALLGGVAAGFDAGLRMTAAEPTDVMTDSIVISYFRLV